MLLASSTGLRSGTCSTHVPTSTRVVTAASTETPIVWPRYQPFGSGLGHIGSTSNLGAWAAPCACATAVRCSIVWAIPRAESSAKKPAPTLARV